MNTARQFALAASVLLVAGVFFVMMRPSPEQKFTSANSKITADVTFDGPARAHAPAAQGAKPEALAAAPEVDERELDEQQVAKGAEPTQAPTELALNTGLGSDSPLSSRPEGMGSPSSSGRAASSMPEERAASSRSNSTEQKPSAPTKRETRARAKPLAESAGAIDRGRKDRAPAAQSAPALADKADFALDSVASAEKSEKAPQAPTDTYRMDAIAESFASAHYDETIARADMLTGDPSVPEADIALAREFKARAQEASGDTSGALDTYQLIQERHPTFKTSVIAAHIRRLDNQLNAAPIYRKRAAPARKSSVDMESQSMDLSADE